VSDTKRFTITARAALGLLFQRHGFGDTAPQRRAVRLAAAEMGDGDCDGKVRGGASVAGTPECRPIAGVKESTVVCSSLGAIVASCRLCLSPCRKALSPSDRRPVRVTLSSVRSMALVVFVYLSDVESVVGVDHGI
jgi:hypothetical protein